MKRCPECRRDYADDTLLYCLEDGAALIQGSVPAREGEPATAILHAALGEKDKAFVWLEKDVAARASRSAQYSVNPIWDDLRDDPRFEALVRKVEQSKLD